MLHIKRLLLDLPHSLLQELGLINVQGHGCAGVPYACETDRGDKLARGVMTKEQRDDDAGW